MALIDLLRTIDDRVKAVNASDFNIEVTETTTVPAFDDPALTYDNLDAKTKKCKRLESCVLYVDIRNSAQISADADPEALARLYSSFVTSMIAAARHYHGHVRNIIGDRVMVVFDRENCFKNAINTAILMNTVSSRIINKHVESVEFKCGIGIDFGKMLVTKAGTIRQGEEKEFYRSLVWLGQPANTASRLTDVANKTTTTWEHVVNEGLWYGRADNAVWEHRTYDEFLDSLEKTGGPTLRHKNERFFAFFKTWRGPFLHSAAPILMTEAVYDGLKSEWPEEKGLNEGWWTEQGVSVRDYAGKVYGGYVYFTDVEQL